MRNDFCSNYLAHHGIQGQKWGKKNGPPYPLGASDHSAAEKKAGWRKSLGADNNKEKRKSKSINGNTKREETQSSKRKLTDSQKKALKIGATVVSAAVVTVGAAYVAKHMNKKIIAGLTKESIQRGRAFGDEYIKTLEQGFEAFNLASEAQRDGRKVDADKLNNIAEKIMDASTKYKKSAEAERRLRNKAFTKSDKIDYVKRLITKQDATKIDRSGLNSDTFRALLRDEAFVNKLRRQGYDIDQIRKMMAK